MDYEVIIQKDVSTHSNIYPETALYVSGGTTTHHQEHKPLYLQHLVFVTPLLLLDAIACAVQRYTVCLKITLYVSGGKTTHLQENKQLCLQHLVFVIPLLLPAAVVEESEPV
jgi:hypothetical protein